MTTLPGWHRPLRRALGLALVLLGCGAAGITGTPGAIVAALTALGVCAGRAWGRPPSVQGLVQWRVANATALVVCILAGGLGTSPLLVALGLVGWLQVHRAFSGPSAAHEQVALLLTLLMVLLTSILTSVAALGPFFVLLAVLGPAALLFAWLEDEILEAPTAHPGSPGNLGPLWGLPLAALALTGLFFLLLPRVQANQRLLDDPGLSMAGFNEEVELGDLGSILDNPQPVLRARVTRGDGVVLPGPHYFRGIALDHFTGSGWSGSFGTRLSPGRTDLRQLPATNLLRQEITLEPLTDEVLFSVGEALSVSGELQGLTVDTVGTWRSHATEGLRTYEVVSLATGASAKTRAAGQQRQELERAALRAGLMRDLPPGLDSRIQALARELQVQAGSGASIRERAQGVARHLRENYRYSTTPDASLARQPLEAFLFETKEGHCEFFATALAILLRGQDLDTRVVNGFLGGERNELGDFVVVRQRDAHSWVEVWVDDEGPGHWLLVDGTPAPDTVQVSGPLQQVADWFAHTWNQRVVDYDLNQQLSLGLQVLSTLQGTGGARAPGLAELPGWLTGLFAGVVGVGGLLGALRFVRSADLPTRRQRPRGAVGRAWARARSRAVRRGWAIPDALPPVEAARWVRARAGEVAAPMEDLAWLHYRVRYGEESDDEHRLAARRAERALRALPRRRGAHEAQRD